ncbi:MAG: DUF1810 domain-containing protein [Pedobacter sp.]|nr:DUF1810 domain-containing protein [Pedobacter sp.]
MKFNLDRFVAAQQRDFHQALAEVKNGRKQSHWMWYIFPQLKGLGQSEMSKFYGLAGLDEASAYLAHPILGKNLIEISNALLDLAQSDALKIFGSPDNLKLRSCMSLFAGLPEAPPVFEKVLQKFYGNIIG